MVRGAVDKWLVGAWLECTDQLGDADALAFNRGGMCELMRSPDAAGRYVAAEIGKRYQKQLPSRYKDGLGRWWWLNPRWEPRPISFGTLNLRFWPFDVPLSHIWEGMALVDGLIDSQTVNTAMPLKHWLRVMGLEAWPKVREKNSAACPVEISAEPVKIPASPETRQLDLLFSPPRVP